MPAKKRLTNIANGLCGSFISRNNDLDGYWAIGKLRSLADQHGQSLVVLDLLTSSAQPFSAQCSDVFERYCRRTAQPERKTCLYSEIGRFFARHESKLDYYSSRKPIHAMLYLDRRTRPSHS